MRKDTLNQLLYVRDLLFTDYRFVLLLFVLDRWTTFYGIMIYGPAFEGNPINMLFYPWMLIVTSLGVPAIIIYYRRELRLIRFLSIAYLCIAVITVGSAVLMTLRTM
jgi:hypothetical protein